jgi:hypothetical protein
MNYFGAYKRYQYEQFLFLITVTSTSCDPCKHIKNMNLLSKYLVSLHIDFFEKLTEDEACNTRDPFQKSKH